MDVVPSRATLVRNSAPYQQLRGYLYGVCLISLLHCIEGKPYNAGELAIRPCHQTNTLTKLLLSAML